MVKINVGSFKNALRVLNGLHVKGISASYWPQGGDTQRESVPVVHQVAVRLEDEALAVQVAGEVCATI